jgi:beta-glucanase (GH16 family)
MNKPSPNKPGRSSSKWVSSLPMVLCFLAMVFFSSTTTRPVLAANNPTWKLTWNDEFSAAARTGVNPANWIYSLGHGYGCAGCPNNWGTGEIAKMTNSTANVYHDGAGRLAIKPIRAGTPGAYTWTSGRIETRRTDFQPAPGGAVAFEARIALPNVTGPAAQGYWPAFWSLGAPFRGNYLNWPSVGEIDVLENVNGQNTVWHTMHCGTAPGGPCNEFTGLGSGPISGWSPPLQGNFYVYRMEFDKATTPQEIRWYMNGVQTWKLQADRVDATTWTNATNHGFFIILNVAIGGGWPGSPTDQTVSGVPMLVDYVRVYNR